MAITAGGDGSFQDMDALAAEEAKIEQAKSDLIDERSGESGELIMGKYGSQDELIAAFKSLQGEYSRLKGGNAQAEAQPEAPSVSEEAPPPQPQEQQQEQPSAEPNGIAPEKAQEVVQAIFKQTGGEAKYQAMSAWAAKTMDDASVLAFNDAIQSGEVGRALNAVKALQYDYMTATGYEPKLIGGRVPTSEGVKGFQSEAQVVDAMSDPRYQNGPKQDPAYVREVEQRLAASAIFS